MPSHNVRRSNRLQRCNHEQQLSYCNAVCGRTSAFRTQAAAFETTLRRRRSVAPLINFQIRHQPDCVSETCPSASRSVSILFVFDGITPCQMNNMHPRTLRAHTKLYNCVFMGEQAQDAGGPYRESWSMYAQELQVTFPLVLCLIWGLRYRLVQAYTGKPKFFQSPISTPLLRDRY